MGSADLGRAEYSRRNAIAQPLQSRYEGVELSIGVPRDVLAEQTTRPALGHDSQDLLDEEPVVAGSEVASDFAVWLARVSRSDAIHEATPRSSVEGGKVRPDRSLTE
jgi:hypothetical protein